MTTENKSAPFALPVVYRESSYQLLDAEGESLAEDIRPVDGDFIARAVNAHTQLVEALKTADRCLLELYSNGPKWTPGGIEEMAKHGMDAIKQALSAQTQPNR